MEIETKNLILKKETDNLIGTYYIYEKLKNTLIGSITYRGYHYNEKLGDIGQQMHHSYTNKGYGKEALFKIIELLEANEIPDFWITHDITNNISKHIIIEHLKGKIISEQNEVIRYVCNTNIKEQEPFTNKKK